MPSSVAIVPSCSNLEIVNAVVISTRVLEACIFSTYHPLRSGQMQLRTLFLAVLAASASGAGLKRKLDINQKVYIQNAPVLGDGAGEAALNNCQAFAAQHVADSHRFGLPSPY